MGVISRAAASSRAAESGHHASSVTRIGWFPLPTAEKRRGRRSAPAIGDFRAPNCLALLGQPCEEAVGPLPTKPAKLFGHWLHFSEKCQTDLSCPRDPELPLTGHNRTQPDSDAHGTVQNGPDIIGQHRTFSDTFSDMLPDMIGHRTGQKKEEL